MMLMHHDTTGTQTDSVKPLSRKNLRSLCNHNRAAFTSKALYFKTGRLNANIKKALAEQEQQRKEAAELAAAESKTTYKLIGAEEPEKKPNLFRRLGSFFGNLQKRAEREKARGK